MRIKETKRENRYLTIVKEKLTMTGEQCDRRKAEKWRKYRQVTVKERDTLLSGERQREGRKRENIFDQ